MGYDRNYLEEMNRIQLAMENGEIKLRDITDKEWRKEANPPRVIIVGDGGKVSDIEALRKAMEKTQMVVFADNLTDEKIREVALAVGQSFATVKDVLMNFCRTVEKTTIKIEDFCVPELNDIYITDQSLPRDAKGFGMSKLGINQRNNFKHRRK